MSSWFGKVGGAVIGGLVGGPVGAIVGAALGHGVDYEFGSDSAGDSSQAFAGLAFPCPHCLENLALPSSGTFHCEACKGPILATVCHACGIGFGAPAPGKYECPGCSAVQDVGGLEAEEPQLSAKQQAQIQLVMGMIALAGKLAKIDGHVSKEEVAVVSEVIKEMEVDEEDEQFLKDVFREAKQSPHDYREVAEDIRRLLGEQSEFAAQIVGFLLHIAIADGVFSDSEKMFIEEVSRIFGLPQDQYRRMVDEICPAAKVHECYQVLGVPPSASMAQVKRRYRELVAKFHPDKLSGKELPEEFERFAQQKMAAINEAYEIILAAQEAGRG